MKKTTKQIIGLSLATFGCAALATALPFANAKAGAATATNVFEIADGASIRCNENPGIRFIVKMSADVKEKIVTGNYDFGFVVSREDKFDNVTDYANMSSDIAMKAVIESENVADKIYEGADEYAGYYCANIVINQGDQDTVENFMERTYSAVAYYTADASLADDGTNYTYTTNRQERSIQDVASKLYVYGDSKWTDVKATYDGLGGENTPILLAQSGKNSYKGVAGRFTANEAFGDGVCFTLAENLIAETDLANDDTFKGTFIDSEYMATFATGVNTGMIAIGGNNNFLYGDVDENSAANYEVNVSFDETKKYDSASNGSYKAEFKVKNGGDTSAGGAYLRLRMNPVYSQTYYQALQEAGYNKIAVRFFLETMNDTTISNGTGVRYINGAEGEMTEMQVYVDNQAKTNKTNTFILWNQELAVGYGKWAEIVLDMEKFAYNCSDNMTLFMMQVGANYDLNTVMYIDNIYAVKGAVSENLTAVATTYQDVNTEFDFATLETNEDAISTALLDGEIIDVVDEKVALSNYGVYTFKKTNRDTYGSVYQKTYVTGGKVVLNDIANFSASTKAGSSDFTVTKDSATGNVTISSTNNSQLNVGAAIVTYKVKTVYDKDYYVALKNAGYDYITYECTFDYKSTYNTLMCRWAYSSIAPTHYNNDATHHNVSRFGYWYKESSTSTVLQTDEANSKSSLRPWDPATSIKGKSMIISFSIDNFINNYSEEMNIASYYVHGDLGGDYSITFGKIAATKEACKF